MDGVDLFFGEVCATGAFPDDEDDAGVKFFCVSPDETLELDCVSPDETLELD